jgi:hypothetical protein
MEALQFDFVCSGPQVSAIDALGAAAFLRQAWVAQHESALSLLPAAERPRFPELVRHYHLATQLQVGIEVLSTEKVRIRLTPIASLAIMYPEGTAPVQLFLTATLPEALGLPQGASVALVAGPGSSWPSALLAPAPALRRAPTWMYVCLGLSLLPWLVGGFWGYRSYVWVNSLQGSIHDLKTQLELATQTIGAQAIQLERIKAAGERQLNDWHSWLDKTKVYLGD